MHYGAYTFAIDHNVPVIEPRDSSISISRLGQRDKLSPYDIMQVNIRYCPGMDVNSIFYVHIYDVHMLCSFTTLYTVCKQFLMVETTKLFLQSIQSSCAEDQISEKGV